MQSALKYILIIIVIVALVMLGLALTFTIGDNVTQRQIVECVATGKATAEQCANAFKGD